MQSTHLDQPLPSQDRISTPVLARWCSLTTGGEAQVDTGKVVNLDTTGDSSETKAQLGSLVRSEAVNSAIWPLIFDGPEKIETKNPTSLATLRSLSFLRGLTGSSEQVSSQRFEALSKEKKRHVALGVRDLYLAAWRGLLEDEEQQLLADVTQTLSTPVEPQVLKGVMPASFHPSASHKMLKFVESLDLQIPDDSLRPFFAQVMSTPRLFAVFVDPTDLSYHNFENIVPLDSWLQTKTSSDDAGEAVLPATLTHLQQVRDDAQVWTGKLALGDSEASDILGQLADLDLYVPPLNSGTRGGERFIFNSSVLSRSLTAAVQQSGILDKIAAAAAPTCPADTFRFVNYVLRCNKFAPGTGKFAQHRDTPYYDAARSQISKYTVLIYPSSGTARSTDEPALRIRTSSDNPGQSDICFHDLEAMQFVIFDQRLEHEGHPFINTDKIFLRTELIFEEPRLRVSWLRKYALEHHDSAVAGLFSEACYMTGHGVFDAEIAAHAHKCYEKVNAMHWGLVAASNRGNGGGGGDKQDGEDDMGVHLLKSFAGLRFLTNGYDYWFATGTVANSSSSDQETLSQTNEIKDCATIALLDHCNVHVSGGRPFRSLLGLERIHDSIRNDQDIIRLLGQDSVSHTKEPKGLRRLTQSDVDAVFPAQDDEKPFMKRKFSWRTDPDDERDEQDDDNSKGGWGCCPCHHYETFDARDSHEVREAYDVCCAYTRRKILGAPITLLGADEEIVINHDNVLVEGDKVYFLRPLPSKKADDDGGGIEVAKQSIGDERRINFAACWTGAPDVVDFIGLAGHVRAMQFLVPPLQFRELVPDDSSSTRVEEDGIKYYHFTMDLFRNDWVVHVNDDVMIPVPAITNDLNDDEGEDAGEGQSAFLRETPGYDYDTFNGLEINSDEKPDETLQVGRQGTRRSRRLKGGDAQHDEMEGADGMLLEKADEEWSTESEAEDTD